MAAIETLLARREGGGVAVRVDARLQDDLDFDSLELAELSAMLEDELGRDPYSAGIVPHRVADVIAFYGE